MEKSQQNSKKEKLEARKARMDKIRADLQKQIQNSNIEVLNPISYREQKNTKSIEILDEAQSSCLKVKGIKSFLQKYELQKKIGQGSNGVVWRCFHKLKEIVLAVKIMQIDEQHILQLQRDFKTFRNLKHENIIQYKSIYIQRKKNKCNLVMQYLPSMKTLLQTTIQSEKELKNICYQIMSGVKYIHSKFICHRDIKPDNILYSKETKKIKIIDFGISKKFSNRNVRIYLLTCTGTLPYKAPEMLQGGAYDERVDIWAIGITIYKLVTGTTPFQDQYVSTTIENILKGQVYFDPKIWDKYSKFLKDLVSRLLKRKNQRISLEHAMSHVWFIYNNQLQLMGQQQSKSQLYSIQNHQRSKNNHKLHKGASLFKDINQEQNQDDIFSNIGQLKTNYSDINGKNMDVEMENFSNVYQSPLVYSDIIQSDNQQQSLRGSKASTKNTKLQ